MINKLTGYRNEHFRGSGVRSISEIINYELSEMENEEIIITLLDYGKIKDEDDIQVYIDKLISKGITDCIWLCTDPKFVDEFYNEIESEIQIDKYTIRDKFEIICNMGREGILVAYDPAQVTVESLIGEEVF